MINNNEEDHDDNNNEELTEPSVPGPAQNQVPVLPSAGQAWEQAGRALDQPLAYLAG